MSMKRLLDKLSTESLPADEPVVPAPEVIGFFVRWVCGLKNWKQSTLAGFADVSLSTIERIERGEKVSDEFLERVGIALGYGPGYFTAPRLRKTPEEAASDLEEIWGNLEPVAVKPLRNELLIRRLIGCHAYLVHRPDVGAEFDGDIANLTEWLDLASFIINGHFESSHSEEVRRRELYADVRRCVHALERRGLWVLAGVMDAPQEGLPDWKVAIISITTKAADPGALKRRHVFVDRRCVALPLAKAA
jgi:transcriptional regulator with XRE-family HTH domain